MFEGIAIGVGSAVITGLIVFLVSALARMWHTPKRLDRIEAILPALLRAVMCVLKNQKEGKCNGSTQDSIQELNDLLTNSAVSKKAAK